MKNFTLIYFFEGFHDSGAGQWWDDTREGDENINNGSQMILSRTHILGENSKLYKKKCGINQYTDKTKDLKD